MRSTSNASDREFSESTTFTRVEKKGLSKGMCFDQYSKRKELFPVNKQSKIPSGGYAPNREYSKQRLDLLCIPFEKLGGRKDPAPLVKDIRVGVVNTMSFFKQNLNRKSSLSM